MDLDLLILISLISNIKPNIWLFEDNLSPFYYLEVYRFSFSFLGKGYEDFIIKQKHIYNTVIHGQKHWTKNSFTSFSKKRENIN